MWCRIVDIAEIQPGAYEIMQGHGNINEAFDDSVMMTIICKPVDLFAPRLVIMGFVSHDERTSFLTGLRCILCEISVLCYFLMFFVERCDHIVIK